VAREKAGVKKDQKGVVPTNEVTGGGEGVVAQVK